MRILLLSRSRVVQELVKLGLNRLENARLEIVENPETLRGDHYDLLLVDDGFEREFRNMDAAHLIAGQRVLLGKAEETAAEEMYSGILAKPFLPGDIRTLLEETEYASSDTGKVDEEHVAAEAAEITGGTEILDEAEIEKIRRLLDVEMTEEDPIGKEKDTGEMFRAETVYSIEEFLQLLERGKVKKLRKILQGAKIHITIEIPEEG